MYGGDRLHEEGHLRGHCIDGGLFRIGEDTGSSCCRRSAAEHALEGTAHDSGVGDLLSLQPLRGVDRGGFEPCQFLCVGLVLRPELRELFDSGDGLQMGLLHSLSGLFERAPETEDLPAGTVGSLGGASGVAQLHFLRCKVCSEGGELGGVVGVVGVVTGVTPDDFDLAFNAADCSFNGVGLVGSRSVIISDGRCCCCCCWCCWCRCC